jgi:hypothetical protein
MAFFLVNNFVLKFYLFYNLKDKQENNEDIIINKGNIYMSIALGDNRMTLLR